MNFCRTNIGSFNPHHTGDWLEYNKGKTNDIKTKVSILIILATGWNYSMTLLTTCFKRFNPHHTGDWLESNMQSMSTEQGKIVSILIILATGWNPEAFYRSRVKNSSFQSSSYWRLAGIYEAIKVIESWSCFNPHHTGDWLEYTEQELQEIEENSFNPHHTGDWLEFMNTLLLHI